MTAFGRTADRGRIPVVSVPEAAVLLGVSEGLIYQLLDKGVLPELPRWSRRRLIPRRAVEVVIERTMADYDPDDLLRATLS
jgi:excisionase family DNA binding protein